MLLLIIDLESLHRARTSEGPTAEALAAARDVATSLHDLSHRLHPTKLRLVGLVAALEQLCEESSRAGMTIGFTHDHVPLKLEPDVMLCVFRVVQEAVQNAIKHSGARKLSVHLSEAEGVLTLSIADDGVGFDVEAAWHKGVGLSSIRERLEAVGGTLQIRSRPGGGTQLTAVVPAAVAAPAMAG
jgi:signal transduction histidine kinase